jgi:hypothetical protein
MNKILCTVGFHQWAWYSDYDQYLFHMGQDTGPLTECRLCGCHKRIENGHNGYTKAKKIERVLTKEELAKNEANFH